MDAKAIATDLSGLTEIEWNVVKAGVDMYFSRKESELKIQDSNELENAINYCNPNYPN